MKTCVLVICCTRSVCPSVRLSVCIFFLCNQPVASCDCGKNQSVFLQTSVCPWSVSFKRVIQEWKATKSSTLLFMLPVPCVKLAVPFRRHGSKVKAMKPHQTQISSNGCRPMSYTCTCSLKIQGGLHRVKPGFHSNAIACVGKQPIMVATASTEHSYWLALAFVA